MRYFKFLYGVQIRNHPISSTCMRAWFNGNERYVCRSRINEWLHIHRFSPHRRQSAVSWQLQPPGISCRTNVCIVCIVWILIDFMWNLVFVVLILFLICLMSLFVWCQFWTDYIVWIDWRVWIVCCLFWINLCFRYLH